MNQTLEKMETAQEFLLRKGINKVHQPHKRYSLTISELVEFLHEFADASNNNPDSTKLMEEIRSFSYQVQ